MVLDTHRLLIPDVVWMDWIKSVEAMPRVWAIDMRPDEGKTGGTSPDHVYQGKLDSMCIPIDRSLVCLAEVTQAL